MPVKTVPLKKEVKVEAAKPQSSKKEFVEQLILGDDDLR
jgi:hypothetical protein